MRTHVKIALAIFTCGFVAAPAAAQVESNEPPLADAPDAAAAIAAEVRARFLTPRHWWGDLAGRNGPPRLTPSPGCPCNGSAFGSLTIGPGGIGSFDWQINDAGPSRTFPNAPGIAGPMGMTINGVPNQVSGWTAGQVTILPGNPSHGIPPTTGAFTWTATPASQFDFQMETLVGPYTTVGTTTDGQMSDFDPTQSYRWTFINFQGPYAGPTSDAQLTADTLFDTTLFANALPSGSSFSWDLVLNGPGGAVGGGHLDLIYTSPVPEPGTLGLVVVGLLGVWRVRRLRGR